MSDQDRDFSTDSRGGDGDETLPAFTQLALKAPIDKVRAAIRRFADEYGLDCREVTDQPEEWDGSMCLAEAGAWTLASEPGVDIEERYVAPLIAEQLVDTLETDGAFFGHDPAAGTLMLTLFSDGAPAFEWRDSLVPGPSHAIVFHDDGTATDEDPRRFALRRMGRPEASPVLDRYAFLEHELEQLGLDTFQPDLDDFPVEAALRLSLESSALG